VISYLDTNVVVWLAQAALERISSKAKLVLNDAELLISPMVLIELEYLFEIKRIRLAARDIQTKVEHEIGARICNLPFAIVASAALDEKWTRDPFDRMIVAQAKANGMAPLISADEQIRKSYLRTVW
jgi:PIN domain nuclease of toxin-antitoxin system